MKVQTISKQLLPTNLEFSEKRRPVERRRSFEDKDGASRGAWKEEKQWAAICSWKRTKMERQRRWIQWILSRRRWIAHDLKEQWRWDNSLFWLPFWVCQVQHQWTKSDQWKTVFTGVPSPSYMVGSTCPPSWTSDSPSKCSDTFSKCQALSFKDG